MKKLVVFFAIALFLSVPLAANATLLGVGDLNVTGSTPIVGNWYADYDGSVAPTSWGYQFTNQEVFCVSGQTGNNGDYKFYTITSDLDTYFGANTFAKLSQAAWIAENYTGYYGSDPNVNDTIKGEAQKAVWKIMGINDYVGTSGIDYQLYQAAASHSDEATSKWFFAYSPAVSGATDFQDYLTPNRTVSVPPVPEPATMLLLGSGLVGLGVLRRRSKKS